jgi:hypothetical protein
LDRGIDPDDVSRRLAVSAVYELPFGRGKLLLPKARGLLNAIVGGWQVNTVSGFESGKPLPVRGANNFTGINYPDALRDPTLSRSERSVERWFDTTAFRNPPNFVIGNAPRTLPRTRGPGLIDVSLSAFKNFRIRERFELQFRAESFNALNHVNYNPPNTAFTAGPGGLNQSANFGRITSALNARSLQFGLRMIF